MTTHRLKSLASFAAFILASANFNAQTTAVTTTYHNIGIEITFGSPPPVGTTANLFIKKQGDVTYIPAHPLTRIATNKFAGSAVQLTDNTIYDIKITSNNFADILTTGTTKNNNYNQSNTAVYYVDSLGNDINNGTSIVTAFRTLGKALNTITAAGSTIYLRKGTYYEGDLSVTRSGTNGNPITIRNFPGHKPIVDGTDTTFKPVWVVHDAVNNVYKTTSSKQPLHAYLNGKHMLHYLNVADLVNKVWNEPCGFYHDGTTFYVRFPVSTTPANNKITIPKSTTAIQIDGYSNIVIKGIEFRYVGYGAYPRGLYLNIASNVIIDSCVFHHTHLGVTFKRNCDFNTVQHCSFNESPKSRLNWDAVKSGGVDYEGGGIGIYTSNLPNKGNVFRYNTFTDLFDAMSPGSEDLAGYTSNMDIYENTFNEVGDDGISLDGVAINIRVYNNTISNYLTGISAAPLSTGPSYIFRNLLYNSNASPWKSNSIYKAYPFKFNVNSSLSTNWVYLYHNTSFTDIPATDGFLFKNYSDWHDIVSRNNIYAGTDYAFDNWSPTNPIDFDYDDMYTTHASKRFYWNGTAYTSLSTFTAATGQEVNGSIANPTFVSIPGADFHLSSSSSIIDKGQIIPGFNDGYNGLKPDIGKYEYGVTAGMKNIHNPIGNVILYPNPATKYITITMNKEMLGTAYFICDMLGRKLIGGKLMSENTSVSLEGFLPGIYLFQLEHGTVIKLVKD